MFLEFLSIAYVWEFSTHFYVVSLRICSGFINIKMVLSWNLSKQQCPICTGPAVSIWFEIWGSRMRLQKNSIYAGKHFWMTLLFNHRPYTPKFPFFPFRPSATFWTNFSVSLKKAHHFRTYFLQAYKITYNTGRRWDFFFKVSAASYVLLYADFGGKQLKNSVKYSFCLQKSKI